MKPNFVLIVADELRADALGCYGNPICRTPSLDSLAAEGTRFDQAMVTQPTCTPSRASLLTGCYPSALKTRMVGCVTPPDDRFLPEVLSAAGYRTASIGKIHLAPQGKEPKRVLRALADHGHYYGFREVDLVNGHGDRCFGPDYDRFLADLVPDADARRARKKLLVPQFAEKAIEPYTYELPIEAHSTSYVAARAVEFLKAAARSDPRSAGRHSDRDRGGNADPIAEQVAGGEADAGGADVRQPFLLHVSFPDPHHPFAVPEPYASMYVPGKIPPPIPHQGHDSRMPPWYDSIYHGGTSPRVPRRSTDRITGTVPADYSSVPPATWAQIAATYYGMTSLLDRGVGTILDALDASGLAESTHVIFVADHGEYLGDHGFIGKGFHFDSSLRVPLIWRSPQPAPEVASEIESGTQGTRRTRAGREAGVHPYTPGDAEHGVSSLLDVAPTILELAGVEEPEGLQGTSMTGALTGGSLPRAAVLTENDDDLYPVRMRTITTPSWKLTRYANHPWGELYDRRADPGETRNLYDDSAHAGVRAELTDMLLEELLCSFDTANGRVQEPAPGSVKWVARHGAASRGEV